ncbi:DUF418 domain-containing protein [Ekhidna sp.]|uniref:DUF418 domain-containing protein n=1 Tax=Ekhidna sp. TaxID=2608089 RepID=UPI0032ED48D4
MQQSPVQPTLQNERKGSLDFLRGIAILGILFINIENFAYPDPWSPYKFGFSSEIDHSVRFWVYFLTQGKFYTMFALLFGTGFYIFLERMESKKLGIKGMDIYSRRLLWLFVIGVIHAYFIWDGDVLYHYAICGFLLFPFRSFKNVTLVLVVLFFASLLLSNAINQVNDRKASYAQYEQSLMVTDDLRTAQDVKNISRWSSKLRQKEADTTVYPPKKSTYLSGLKETYDHASVHKGMWYYQGLLLRSLIVMIIGIVLYRSGIFDNFRVWKYYWLISLSLLILSLYINYVRYYHWTFEYFDPVLTLWKELFFVFPKELLGVSYILVLNGVYQKFLKGMKFKIISSIGKMALSNYLFQSIVLGFIFYGYGLGKFNEYTRTELLPIVGLIWIVQLLLTWLWLRRHKQGPVEWLWRKLTYHSFNK